jgi:hypothetical protein
MKKERMDIFFQFTLIPILVLIACVAKWFELRRKDLMINYHSDCGRLIK